MRQQCKSVDSKLAAGALGPVLAGGEGHERTVLGGGTLLVFIAAQPGVPPGLAPGRATQAGLCVCLGTLFEKRQRGAQIVLVSGQPSAERGQAEYLGHTSRWQAGHSAETSAATASSMMSIAEQLL